MRKVTHPQHQTDYNAGWDAMAEFIAAAGIDAAKAKFNCENPVGQNPQNLGAYYYACGELDALVARAA